MDIKEYTDKVSKLATAVSGVAAQVAASVVNHIKTTRDEYMVWAGMFVEVFRKNGVTAEQLYQNNAGRFTSVIRDAVKVHMGTEYPKNKCQRVVTIEGVSYNMFTETVSKCDVYHLAKTTEEGTSHKYFIANDKGKLVEQKPSVNGISYDEGHTLIEQEINNPAYTRVDTICRGITAAYITLTGEFEGKTEKAWSGDADAFWKKAKTDADKLNMAKFAKRLLDLSMEAVTKIQESRREKK